LTRRPGQRIRGKTKVIAMDYGKSGNAKMSKKGPVHKEHNAPGSDKKPFGSQPDKAALLKKMKAAAEANKKKGK
jgi:hypothetical protein